MSATASKQVQALLRDPVILSLAKQLADVPVEKLLDGHGNLTLEFVVGANREYCKQGGGESPLYFTAVAEALLQLLQERAAL